MVQKMYTFDEVGQKRMAGHRGGVRQRYILTDQGRRLLLETYDGTSACIDMLVERLGVPRWKVNRWAGDLGLARQKEPYWTQEDEDYLERNLHRKSVADIAKTLNRTQVAVRLKAKRLGVNKLYQEGYTMRGLCMALGCDHRKVKTWVERGWLKGTRRQSERVTVQGGDVWLFTNRDVRHFVIKHPTEIDQRRCDWIWMVDLLAGGDFYGTGELTRLKGEPDEPA